METHAHTHSLSLSLTHASTREAHMEINDKCTHTYSRKTVCLYMGEGKYGQRIGDRVERDGGGW